MQHHLGAFDAPGMRPYGGAAGLFCPYQVVNQKAEPQ